MKNQPFQREAPPETVIVVPCYNEQKRLPRQEFIDYLTADPETCFLFVNDGSTDQTEKVIRELASLNPGRMAVLSLTKNSGKAEAVRRGLLLALGAKANAVGFWDADLATPLNEIPTFQDLIRNRPDVEMVLGARVNLLGRKIERKKIRHYIGRVFATMASCYLRVGIYDTQCGAKLFRVTPQLQQLLSKRFVARWLFDLELIVRFLQFHRRKGVKEPWKRIVEQPLQKWTDVKGSKVKATDFPKALGEFITIIRTYGF